MEKLKLETERLILKEWENTKEEIDVLVTNLNDKDFTRGFVNTKFPYSKKDAKEWLSKMDERKSKSGFCFKIIEKNSNKIIGNISLSCRDDIKNAEFGYWICREKWNNGYATEVLRKIIEFSFSRGIHKICGKHFADNPASGKVMKKCGMKKEGKQKEQVFRDGIYHDEILYGIINKGNKNE